MSDKSLKIQAEIAIANVEETKRRLQEINGTFTSQKMDQQGTVGGFFSGLTKGTFDQADKQRRSEFIKYANEQMKINKELLTNADNKLKNAKALTEELKNHNKESEKYKQLTKEIQDLESKASDYKKSAEYSTDKVYNQAKASGVKSLNPHVDSATTLFANVGKMLSVVSAVVATGTAIYDQYKGIPINRAAATGNAIQNGLGSDLQNIASGNVIDQMAYSPERLKARNMASERMESSRKADTANAFGTAGIGGIGSLVGNMFGMGNGSLWDLTAGGVTGAAGGALQNKTAFGPIANSIGKKLSAISEEYSSAYEAKLLEDYGNNYQKTLEAEKRANPLKSIAVNQFSQNYAKDLQFQRSLGMTDQQLFGKGGFQESANVGGFNSDLAMQMSGQIQAAGGSTRGSKGNALLGLGAQRGFDLTNAGSVLGKISNTAGNAGVTDQIFRKLMEESVKAGLDKSEFREEQRRFADITADILNRSGVTNADDAQKTLQGFQRFLGGGNETTLKGMEGSKSAYEEFQKSSAETSGRGGALNFAGMMKDKDLRKISPGGLAGLMEIPDEQLQESDPFIIAKAQEAGITPRELVSKLKKKNREKTQVEVGLSPERMSALSAFEKQNNIKPGEASYDQLQEMQKSDPEMYKSYHQLENAASAKSGYENVQKRISVVRGLQGGEENGPVVGPPSPAELARQATIDQKMKSDTGRAGDEVIKSTGVAAEAMLENFRKFKDEITPTANALDALTKKLVLLAEIARSVPDKDRPYAMEYASQQLRTNAPRTQPQAGKTR